MGRVDIIEVVPSKSFLGVSVSQYHLVLFHILNLSVFRNALFVVSIIFFDSLNELKYT
jgi:hypothetical protein